MRVSSRLRSLRFSLLLPILVPAAAVAQPLVSDNHIHEARAAGMGGAFSALADGPWGGLYNPAAHASQPLLQGGFAWVELDEWNPGARLESGAGSISLGRHVGVGVARTRFLYGETVFPVDGAPDRVLRPRDQTDLVGAAVDIVGLLSPQVDDLELSIGANYKRLISKLEPASATSLVLREEEQYDWDVGALLGWMIQLDGPDRFDRSRLPRSHMRFRTAFVARNIRNGDAAVAPESSEDPLPSSVIGASVELALGRIDAAKHAFILRVAGERSRYHEELPTTKSHRHHQRVFARGYRVGAEVLLGGFVSGRYGRFDDPVRRLESETYGCGVQFLIPELRINVRGDYAHVPLRSVAPSSAPEDLVDRYSAVAWIDF